MKFKKFFILNNNDNFNKIIKIMKKDLKIIVNKEF